MKTAEELATKHAISKSYFGYGKDGFMCQIHYPELRAIIEDRDNEWKRKIKKALEATTNFHCKNTLKDLLEG